MPKFPTRTESREFQIGPARVRVFVPTFREGGTFFLARERWNGQGWVSVSTLCRQVRMESDEYEKLQAKFSEVFTESVAWVKKEGAARRESGVWE